MVQIIFILITLFVSYKIIKSDDSERLYWYLGGILFLNTEIVIVYSPYLSSIRVLTIVMAITCLFKDSKQEWKDFPLIIPLICTFILLLMVGILDARLSFMTKIIRPVNYFLYTMFIVYISFLSFKDEKHWIQLTKVLYILTLFVCLYGLFNHFIRFNPYNAIIMDYTGARDISNAFQESTSRARISSFTNNPIFYGYLVSVLLFVLIYNHLSGIYKITIKEKFTVILFILLLVNLYLSNSRTPYAVFVAGTAAIVFLFFDNKKRWKAIVVFLCIAAVLMTIPVVRKSVETVTDIFASEQEIEGSSIEMRMMQLEAAIAVFDLNIYTGNGYDYIWEGLGFNSDTELSEADKDFQGFESYIFVILIEQGLVGIVANIIFFGSLFFWFFRQRKFSTATRQISTLGIVIIGAFLFFSIATGALYSWFISMFFIGISMKRIMLEKENIAVDSENLFDVNDHNE